VSLRAISVLIAFFGSALPLSAGSTIVASRAALSTTSPYATSVGLAAMKRGGTAMDAAVAVSFTLAVVHPQAGNLGGGTFIVYYDSESNAVWTLDARETAPGAAKRDMFVLPDGNISPASRTGVRAAGVPGTVAGLGAAHARFGKLPWKELLAPSVSIAREGFRTDFELQRELGEEEQERKIAQFPSTAAIFFPDGQPLPIGSKLVQADLAATIERIAATGPSEFYEGDTAKKLVEAVRAGGGIISARDLRDYKPVWRAPLKIRFKEYDIYTMPPPSGGGLVLAETLNILSTYDLKALGFQTLEAIHLMAEAERRAYIDRNRHVGDPATTRIPFRELLSAERAAAWRNSIDPKRATPTVALVDTNAALAEGKHTTHFTIVDEHGNIASVTTTLNENFGSGFIVPGAGFLLNNEMDDFTAAPGKANRSGLVASDANAIEPGKRMASSMTPTIIFKGRHPFLALGTRGGPTIPTSILQVFLNVAIHGQSITDAVAAPRYHHQADPERIDYERGKAPQEILEALNRMGHGVNARDPIGDIHAIAWENGDIIAVADPRRGGAAGGY
jgi:gamma-glutamyltranspeptidase / glutathione hydrolase